MPGGISQSFPGTTEAALESSVTSHAAFRSGPGGCTAAELCPACSLFGMQSGRTALRSRISVSDFVPSTDTSPKLERISTQWSPRLHHCAPREAIAVSGVTLRLRALRGRKFHRGRGSDGMGATHLIETLPAGTALVGTLRFFNLTPAELGGLLAACGLAPVSYVKMGAGKGLGFGRLRPDAIDWALRDERGRSISPNPGAYVEAFRTSGDRFAQGLETLVALHTREA